MAMIVPVPVTKEWPDCRVCEVKMCAERGRMVVTQTAVQ